LTRELAADELLSLRAKLFGKFKRRKPILQIHSHIQREDWVRRFCKHFLSDVVLEKNRGDVADQNLLVRFSFDRLDTVDHAHIFAHLESNFCWL
jgi:hypothetical protein